MFYVSKYKISKIWLKYNTLDPILKIKHDKRPTVKEKLAGSYFDYDWLKDMSILHEIFISYKIN